MSQKNNIKHIFFDLDHTLWDFETNSKKTYGFIFNKNNIKINLDVFISCYSPINFNYWKLFREEKISKKNLRFGRLKDTFTKLNYTVKDQLINKLADEYLENLSNYNQLFTDAIEILEYLNAKYKLHIITNGFKEIQYAKMKNSNILHFFDTIVTSECVGLKKPNPEIFFYALKKANAKTYESIMIGDSLEADIYGAKNVGIDSLHFNINNGNSYNTINKLIQIKKYL
jgi:putative hydrolase of the HAD superfamily